MDDQQDISYVVPYGKQTNLNRRYDELQKSLEDLYSKPVKRKSSSLPRQQQNYHVHFGEKNESQSRVNMGSSWTKSFLEELQEKAAQIGMKNRTDEETDIK